MLVATGFTPLLVNLESMTSKPNAGGGSKKLCCMERQEGRAKTFGGGVFQHKLFRLTGCSALESHPRCPPGQAVSDMLELARETFVNYFNGFYLDLLTSASIEMLDHPL